MEKINLFIAICLSLVSAATADVKLNRLFTDNMVLQRSQKVPVWGTADAGAEITVEFAGQKKTTVTGDDGKWTLSLDPMTVSSAARKMIVASDVSGFKSPMFLSVTSGCWAGSPIWPVNSEPIAG